jgi:hypothetical protein
MTHLLEAPRRKRGALAFGAGWQICRRAAASADKSAASTPDLAGRRPLARPGPRGRGSPAPVFKARGKRRASSLPGATPETAAGQHRRVGVALPHPRRALATVLARYREQATEPRLPAPPAPATKIRGTAPRGSWLRIRLLGKGFAFRRMGIWLVAVEVVGAKV